MATLSEMVASGTALSLEAHPFAVPSPVPAGSSTPEPACRFAGELLHWLRVPAGVAVLAMARSARRVYQQISPGLPDGTAGNATLIEVSPLPGFIAPLLRTLTGGLPTQYLLLSATDSGAIGDPDKELCVASGDTLVTPASPAWLGVCFQDRICRDPRSWVHELDTAAAALPAASRSSGWPGFVSAVEGTGPARVRVLDHVGRPLATGTFEVHSETGADHTVVLTNASPSDTGVDVTGAGASVSVPGSSEVVLASAQTDRGGLGEALSLTDTDRHVLYTQATDWLAERTAGVTGLARWTKGSTVEPIVDGNPYFARLVPDLRAAKGGGDVALAGWAFVKESLQDSTKPWSLLPEDNSTEVVKLIDELVTGGAAVRMLVNQFLQFSDADLATLHGDVEALLLAAMALVGSVSAIAGLANDETAWVALIAAYSILPFLPDSALASLLRSKIEPSKGTIEEINTAHPGIAVWTPYPATLADNPLATDPLKILGVEIPFARHFGMYHHKIAMSRPKGGELVAYMGGIDINSDRVDDPLHRAIAPFHDVQVRLTGPAANEVALTVAERAVQHGTHSTVAAAPDSTKVPATGRHIAQIGRTYFAPHGGFDSGQPFPSAPSGEHTTHDTLVRAIGNARDFIYIEDQYFTPDTTYLDALVDAGRPERAVRALVITVPDRTDQPFGSIRRSEIFSRLQGTWKDRLKVGSPVRRYLNPVPANFAGLGRMVLRAGVGAGDSELVLGPAARVPKPPFWAFVGGELVLVENAVSGGSGKGAVGAQDALDPDPADQTWQRVTVQRGPLGAAPRWGATPSKHNKGRAVLAVQIPGIYVHAKLMIVDDVFLSVGSSNLNRRGLEHDGEINCFTLSASLKRDPQNPAMRLRCRLWAEHLGLSPELGLSLLADPMSALPYFDRSWYRGSRWQPLLSPAAESLLTTSLGGSVSGAVGVLLGTVELAVVGGAERSVMWSSIVDPTTANDPHIDPTKDMGPAV